MKPEENKFIDEEELTAAQDDAEKEENEPQNNDSGKRIVILRKPINVLGTEYKELHFDYNSLTGKDSIAVEEEIERIYHATVITPALNLEYLIRISVRACIEPISRDDIVNLNLSDFTHIRSMARNFMLRSDR